MSKKRPVRKYRIAARSPSQRRAVGEPRLVTPEGDELVLARAHYTHNALAEIRQILQPLAEFDLGDVAPNPDGSLHFAWFETQPNPRSPAFFGDRRILATLTLTDQTLVVETISRQRLDNCRQRLDELLGDRLHLVRTETKRASQALREGDVPAEPGEPVVLPPEVMAELEEKMLRQWIDESIPALGGLTPREAVKTPKGRRQVLDLLDYIERQEQRMEKPPGVFSPDYRKVKKMLGLE